jgi:hypothetical protein
LNTQFRRGTALPALRLHGLRHSYVTTSAEQGVSPRGIADAVGHADVSVPERYYRHAFERVQEVAQEQVASAIRSAGRWCLKERNTGGIQSGCLRAAGAPTAREGKRPLCRAKKMVGVARFELATPSPPD